MQRTFQPNWHVPVFGRLMPSTPGLVGGLSALHSNHGKQSWSQMCNTAAEVADSGFVTHAYRTFAANNLQKLNANEISKSSFTDGGEVPSIGDIITQPSVTNTLC